MDSNVERSVKRRKLEDAVTDDSSFWRRCHSGFDDEIIMNEQLRGSLKHFKGKKRTSRMTKDASSVSEKEIEIDWESSSDDESRITDQTPVSPQPKAPERTCSGWMSPRVNSGHSQEISMEREHITINDHDMSPQKIPSKDSEADGAGISDYESSEPSSQPKHKQISTSQSITPTESPMIASFTQSTHESDASPITSTQWIDKLKQGQQATPSKADETEGKDSAKKNIKFKRCGFADQLKKMKNREKSDIAFWQHQASSQLESSGAICSVKITSLQSSQGMFVSHCQNIDHSTDTQLTGNLPEHLVVLFSRKTVEDKNLQVGCHVTIHPPWQRLLLPKTSTTVLLCTYFCQKTELDDPVSIIPASSSSVFKVSSSPCIATTPRPLFRPNRLFGGDTSSPKLCLNASVLSQSDCKAISESLIEVLSTNGPGFDFEFSLRVLVLKVCKVLPVRTSLKSMDQRWRLLCRDRDGTVFEVQGTSDVGKNWSLWQGKIVDFHGLKITQRIARLRNPSLFSMIDSYRKSSVQEFPNTTGQKRDVSQNISYLVNLEDSEGVSECKDERTLNLTPTKHLNLHDICQKQQQLHRASFHARLLYSTPKEILNPVSTENGSELFLLFVTDSSLHPKPKQTNIKDLQNLKNYVLIEKLPSCPVKPTECVDYQTLSGPVLYFEDVFIKEDKSLLLDGYSAISKADPDEDMDLPEACDLVYPELTKDTTQNTLISIAGTMVGVDECTACSWPVCDICKGTQLEENTSGTKLFCKSCDRVVTSPIIKVHLKILVKCSSFDGSNAVKVKLKQETIKNLFGDPSSTEPFDLKRILGKPFQKTRCFVRKFNNSGIGHADIELEEI